MGRLIDADDLPISYIDITDAGYYVSKYGQGIPVVYLEDIKDAPTIEPEPQWIPCDERLPEDSQFVLMTIRRMDKRYSHEPFISVGYISWNQLVWWCAHDGDCKSHDVRVDAWMPLPEPFRGKTND